MALVSRPLYDLNSQFTFIYHISLKKILNFTAQKISGEELLTFPEYSFFFYKKISYCQMIKGKIEET